MSVPCGCQVQCGDIYERRDSPYAVCKGLPAPPREPLVEIVLVPRWPAARSGGEQRASE